MEKTLAIIKPDAVRRGLVGAIIHRIERALPKIKIIDMCMVHMTKKDAEWFYAVHKGKEFFERLTDFMASGPCIALVLKGENVIDHWRIMMGATDYRKAMKGTIRWDYGQPDVPMHENLVHGSDSPESASYEIDCYEFDLKGE